MAAATQQASKTGGTQKAPTVDTPGQTAGAMDATSTESAAPLTPPAGSPALGAAAGSGCSDSALPAGLGLHTLIFCDDFAGTTLDQSKWNTFITSRAASGRPWNSNGTGGSAGGCYYDAEYFLPRQVTVNNGLRLTAAHQAYDGVCNGNRFGYQWISGVVSSYNHFQFTGGYVEFTMKPPAGSGFWPALWLMPGAGGTGGDDNEIDVQEGGFLPAPTSQRFAYHSHTGTSYWGGTVDTGVDLTAAFHTYGLLWIPGKSLAWYLDGRQLTQTTSARFPIPSDPHELIMNLSVCTPDASDFHPPYDAATPGRGVMQVASVKVWQ
jgi:beta-glucanase (GH16 family)